jgi:mycothiol synthase
MQNFLLHDDLDLADMRGLLRRASASPGIVDFEEHVLLDSVRSAMRLWRDHGSLLGFGYVDDFDNLWFEIDRGCAQVDQLGSEIVQWGLTCVQERTSRERSGSNLDASCSIDDAFRIGLFQGHGFAPQPVRSLRFSRSLTTPIDLIPLAEGFSIRRVSSRAEVPQLIALHRQAFGTDQMTQEQRLAMMSTDSYLPELDLVVVAPDSELAAFCVCGWHDRAGRVAYTDPIGTHPRYRGHGLAAAVVSAALRGLRKAGALTATLSTSSENLAMQLLAARLGFRCVSERLWFSRKIRQPVDS